MCAGSAANANRQKVELLLHQVPKTDLCKPVWHAAAMLRRLYLALGKVSPGNGTQTRMLMEYLYAIRIMPM